MALALCRSRAAPPACVASGDSISVPVIDTDALRRVKGHPVGQLPRDVAIR